MRNRVRDRSRRGATTRKRWRAQVPLGGVLMSVMVGLAFTYVPVTYGVSAPPACRTDWLTN